MMWVVIRKSVLVGCGVLLLLLSVFAFLLWREYDQLPFSKETRSAFSANSALQSDAPQSAIKIMPPSVIVIDPGHGGEDGGAVSPEGIAESGINLEISRKVRDLMIFFGQDVVMTRTEDVSIGDADLPTVRQRKNSDIRRRVEIANAQENALLLSIHQNILPSSPVTWGAQVFWNRQAGGEALAKSIQAALNEEINAGNPKQAREIDPSIYLMKYAEIPAALVECGFLSNPAEVMRLLDNTWQTKIAAAITAGTLCYTSNMPSVPSP